MKAAVVTGPNTWALQDFDVPKPGPGQVLIRIRASGMCYTDVHQASGHVGMKFPMRLGHEPVGDITEIGDDVRTRKVGDRVGVPWVQSWCGRCEWCLRDQHTLCKRAVQTAITVPGGHAEFMLAYEQGTILIPEALSFEQAAPIFCAGYTVYSGLRMAKPQPHERVAVVGVGGLGHLAVQYAKAAGYETIAISHSPDKDEMITKELGADAVVRDGLGLLKAGGADIILATGNSTQSMQDAMRGLRPWGRLVVMGIDSTPLQLVGGNLLSQRASVLFSSQNGVSFLYEALDYAAKGKVKVMAERFHLNDVAEAYEKVSEGKVRFRAVIVPE